MNRKKENPEQVSESEKLKDNSLKEVSGGTGTADCLFQSKTGSKYVGYTDGVNAGIAIKNKDINMGVETGIDTAANIGKAVNTNHLQDFNEGFKDGLTGHTPDYIK